MEDGFIKTYSLPSGCNKIFLAATNAAVPFLASMVPIFFISSPINATFPLDAFIVPKFFISALESPKKLSLELFKNSLSDKFRVEATNVDVSINAFCPINIPF